MTTRAQLQRTCFELAPASILHGMRIIVRRAIADDLEALLDVQEEGAVAGLANVFPQDLYPFPRAAVRRRWEEELVIRPGRCTSASMSRAR